ncbi:hypothetical protein [Streptoalloteichus tenebrarius]|nr:hypothetical protein [Streptoalloteichus tenebrarius]BFE98337.1 hypothetical protein GCM10020241_00130 [Streptoalloteichus tenebrarius]
MYVELDVFSGRPNPRWELSSEQARQLADRLKGRDLSPPLELDQLGFRQFVVSLSPGETFPLPSRFGLLGRVRPVGKQTKGWTWTERVETARWLLGTSAEVDEEVREHVVNALTEEEKIPCKPSAPPFDPNYWNDKSRIEKNNCYNYAANHASDTFAQPGRLCGQQYTSFDCDNVREAAVCDGLRKDCVDKARKVALVIWPGKDFHWYGYHSNDFWGHKAGKTKARNTDEKGKVIDNPETCDRGPYTSFCGYLWVPQGQKVK